MPWLAAAGHGIYAGCQNLLIGDHKQAVRCCCALHRLSLDRYSLPLSGWFFSGIRIQQKLPLWFVFEVGYSEQAGHVNRGVGNMLLLAIATRRVPV